MHSAAQQWEGGRIRAVLKSNHPHAFASMDCSSSVAAGVCACAVTAACVRGGGQAVRGHHRGGVTRRLCRAAVCQRAGEAGTAAHARPALRRERLAEVRQGGAGHHAADGSPSATCGCADCRPCGHRSGNACLPVCARHEEKTSVVHFTLTKFPGVEDPIKSKVSAGFPRSCVVVVACGHA